MHFQKRKKNSRYKMGSENEHPLRDLNISTIYIFCWKKESENENERERTKELDAKVPLHIDMHIGMRMFEFARIHSMQKMLSYSWKWVNLCLCNTQVVQTTHMNVCIGEWLCVCVILYMQEPYYPVTWSIRSSMIWIYTYVCTHEKRNLSNCKHIYTDAEFSAFLM